MVYKEELETWRANRAVDLHVTVDVGDESWKGNVGLVTELFKKVRLEYDKLVAYVCGPPIMIHFVILSLLELGCRRRESSPPGAAHECGVESAATAPSATSTLHRRAVFSYAQIKELECSVGEPDMMPPAPDRMPFGRRGNAVGGRPEATGRRRDAAGPDARERKGIVVGIGNELPRMTPPGWRWPGSWRIVPRFRSSWRRRSENYVGVVRSRSPRLDPPDRRRRFRIHPGATLILRMNGAQPAFAPTQIPRPIAPLSPCSRVTSEPKPGRKCGSRDPAEIPGARLPDECGGGRRVDPRCVLAETWRSGGPLPWRCNKVESSTAFLLALIPLLARPAPSSPPFCPGSPLVLHRVVGAATSWGSGSS